MNVNIPNQSLSGTFKWHNSLRTPHTHTTTQHPRTTGPTRTQHACWANESTSRRRSLRGRCPSVKAGWRCPASGGARLVCRWRHWLCPQRPKLCVWREKLNNAHLIGWIAGEKTSALFLLFWSLIKQKKRFPEALFYAVALWLIHCQWEIRTSAWKD